MISSTFYKKRLGVPWISLVLITTCTIIWIATLLDKNLFYVFATFSKPRYFWQYFSGTFQHSIQPKWFLFAHFLGNISVVIFLGALIEKVIGTRKYILLSVISGSLIHIVFFFTTNNANSTIVGISGVAWSYGPIACYILYLQFKRHKLYVFSNIIYLGIIMELLSMWVFVSIVAPVNTNLWHAIATITGVIFLIFYKQDIKFRVNEIDTAEIPYQRCSYKNNRIIISISWLIPAGAILIMILYLSTGLDKLFVDVVNISSYKTGKTINENNSTIEIEFNDKLTKNGITSIMSSFDKDDINFEITYSKDRKKVVFDFNEPLSDDLKGSITILSGEFESGKILKVQEIIIDQ